MTAPDETPREHAIPPTRDHEPHCPPERTTMNAVTDVLTPPAIGQPFAGGIFAGHFFLAEQPYALVLSPKDHGEIEEIAWNKSRKRVADALSYADGLRNTEAMAAAGSALAKRIRELSIDGCDDWYLPSRLEALLLFGELKGTPACDLELNWYWTSTQYAGLDEYAWIQYFGNGTQDLLHKDSRCRARAVRRVPIR